MEIEEIVASRGVALAGLGHAGADGLLLGFVLGHGRLFLTGQPPRDSRSRDRQPRRRTTRRRAETRTRGEAPLPLRNGAVRASGEVGGGSGGKRQGRAVGVGGKGQGWVRRYVEE